MDELIKQLTGKFGVDASTATNLTAKTMEVVKENVGSELFSKISAAVPGLGDMLAGDAEGAPSKPASSGGLMGMVTGLATSFLGKKAGSGLELGNILANAGISSDKLGGFLETIVEFIREKAGNEIVEQVLEKVPMLKALMK